jgi:hypothetical protein
MAEGPNPSEGCSVERIATPVVTTVKESFIANTAT